MAEDIRIIMKDGRDLRECTQVEKTEVYGAFCLAYVEELEKDVRNKPEEYAWPDKSHEEVLRVVAKMVGSIYHGRANNSHAIRRAAKRMGLNGSMKYTRALVQQSFPQGA